MRHEAKRRIGKDEKRYRGERVKCTAAQRQREMTQFTSHCRGKWPKP